MSNPGVIELVNTNLGRDNFRVEDNLGESIHLHLNNFRIDLTCEQFLDLAKKSREIIRSMVFVNNFDIESFDELFLFEIAEMLPDLVEVKMDEIFLNNLQIDTFNKFHLPCIKSLNQSRVFKALNGVVVENNSHQQKNLFSVTNQDRLDSVLYMINHDGYPCKEKYIILFNNQNIIRDGQHRAACLLYTKGNIKVPVMRLIFKDNKHNIKNHLILRYIFIWNRWRVKNAIKGILLKLKRIKSKIKLKIRCKIISIRLRLSI